MYDRYAPERVGTVTVRFVSRYREYHRLSVCHERNHDWYPGGTNKFREWGTFEGNLVAELISLMCAIDVFRLIEPPSVRRRNQM